MIHITDGKSDKILDFITAKNIIDNNHRQSLKDNLETFDFITFADRTFSPYLGKHNRVIIPAEDQGYQEFVIQEAGKTHEQSLEIEVFASASYLLLKKAKIMDPQTFAEHTLPMLVGSTLSGTEWRPGIMEGKGIRTMHIEQHTNPYAFLKRIATEFGLELRFRLEVKGGKIVGRFVDLIERVGQWRGREVEFGRDLINIKRVEKTDNLFTALKGLGPERDDGTRLEVIVEDNEALQRWCRPDPITGELKHLWDTYEPQSTDQNMSLSRLKTLTENELEKRVNEVVEYESTIADLEHVPGMENKKIRFGDTINIKDTKFNPPLYLEARVHTQDRSITDKSKKKVSLGDYIEYTEEQVQAIWKQMQAEIRAKLARMLITTVEASSGNIFKNGNGSTDLTATVFLSGKEVDSEGIFYTYVWNKRDKNGIPVSSFNQTGKTITVTSAEIDEKATYSVDVVKDTVLSIGRITVSNVNDGSEGLPGPPGEDGKTPYFHTAYSDSANGSVNFSTTDPTDRDYIGTYTDYTALDSSDPSKYKWQKVKGEKGDRGLQGLQGPEGKQGIPGEPGEDGRTPYTHIAYADDDQGNGLAFSPDNKPYMGMYVDYTSTDSNNPADYKWSLIKGRDGSQGVPGPKGEDGKTPYFHTAYANSADGTSGFSTTDSANKLYIGQYTDFIQTDSSNPSKYKWTKIKGEQGAKGDKGDTGPQGPEGPIGPNEINDNTSFSDKFNTIGNNYYYHGNLSAKGWYRIAVNSGNRAFAKFILVDKTSSNHQTVIFEAIVNYNSRPKITVSSSSRYSSGVPFSKARILTGTTYDDTFLEVYVDSSRFPTNSEVYITENIQTSGWVGIDWQPGAVPTGYAIYEVDIDIGSTATDKAEGAFDRAEQAESTAKGHADAVSEAAYLDAIADAEAYMEANGVMQGADYNGVSITNQDGFTTARGDGLVRTVMNSTLGYVIQRRNSLSSPWQDMFYLDTNGNLIFAGDLNGVGGSFAGTLESAQIIVGPKNPTDPHLIDHGNALTFKMPMGSHDRYWGEPVIFDFNYGVFNILGQLLMQIDSDLSVNGKLLLEQAGNPGIEVRSKDGGTPYIDFSNDAITDYHARLILDTLTRLAMRGITQLHFDTSDTTSFTGGGFTRLASMMSKGAEFVVGADSNPRVWSKDIYNRTYSAGGNVVVTDSGTLGRSTSASKYKLDIENQFPNELDQLNHSLGLLDVFISHWFDKSEAEITSKECEKGNLICSDNFKLKRHVGLIAEHVERAGLSEHVSYNEETNEIEGIEYDRLWVHLLPIVRNARERITTLEEKLNKQDTLINNLLERVAALENAK
ncbi:phage tail spike protein [Virgibacillus halodenitrificans]|uniref:Phage tail protein n=1 Tax=Virgibacillus halodenitrificans TaxID=1482 RepID=A0ABR7VNS6_VIRHA|nr:phage tail spike protein [Virgibacillus halodenitrificans]MBD1223298.1 phage tail protein [Virgibacillus halodenitrificans]